MKCVALTAPSSGTGWDIILGKVLEAKRTPQRSGRGCGRKKGIPGRDLTGRCERKFLTGRPRGSSRRLGTARHKARLRLRQPCPWFPCI